MEYLPTQILPKRMTPLLLWPINTYSTPNTMGLDMHERQCK